jgi:hypothetical protein
MIETSSVAYLSRLSMDDNVNDASSNSSPKEPKSRSKNARKSSSSLTKVVKRRRTGSSKERNLPNGIPIFTDAFLDLYRKQKSEIRSLKLIYSQLSERFKLKDAQEEQIRLDNQKMCADIEEISQKNSSILNQLDKIESEFNKVFHQELNEQFFQSLHENVHQTDYQSNLQQICQTLQL